MRWLKTVVQLRGLGAPVAKSAALSFVSVAPPLARRSDVVFDGAGAGPEPSYPVAVVPYPTKSTTVAPPTGLEPERSVVVEVRATLPAVAAMPIVPVASGGGRLWGAPVPAASCSRE